MKKDGFTLAELLVAITIVGILATVSTPRFIMYIAKAKASELPSYFATISVAQDLSWLETNTYVVVHNARDLDSLLGVQGQKSRYFNYSTGLTKNGNAGEHGLGILFGQGEGLNKEEGYWVLGKAAQPFGGVTEGDYVQYAFFNDSKSEGIMTNTDLLSKYLKAYLSGFSAY